jgi:hypothetical protein
MKGLFNTFDKRTVRLSLIRVTPLRCIAKMRPLLIGSVALLVYRQGVPL